jgi:hypothetical protein
VLGREPRAFCMLGKCSITELHSNPILTIAKCAVQWC